jgi:hypothetical protein
MNDNSNEMLKKLIARIERSGILEEFKWSDLTTKILIGDGYILQCQTKDAPVNTLFHIPTIRLSYRLFRDDIELAIFEDNDEVAQITEVLERRLTDVRVEARLKAIRDL